ncbi:peptide-binding protein [Geoalkalibacter halelectricus]|uniref:Peptide-binding protein n=1 Tax=Geoalkalibacter halelectricus TaxID=2847045 RepID=A0ABY5ZKY8_9BACT|nr:peptide-binding protein [Geoalkalibacter halelectricus]MDO3379450.1 peptide-binding protein [Geoalkalibacter halelectricus]UWZ79509.1 peptide-binding protein [Geoalkalibacter halelectricus]
MHLVFIALFLALLIGCQRDDGLPIDADEVTEPAYGDTIIQGSIGEPSTLIPALASDSASSDINGLVYSGLVRYDKNLEIEGELAESWEISDDGLTLTFHLRRGVTWHDGAPFTSADVMFTYELMVDPNTPTAYADRYLQVVAAEAPDPYTFRVHYAEPLASALISWGLAIHPRHLLEGQDVTRSPLARAPIGTGPFRFVQWVSGQRLILEANPDYFEGRPYVNRVIYRIIPDSATMFLELQAGNLDQMGLTPIQYARQTETATFQRRFNKFRYPASSYVYLGYNLRRPLFEDRRVRQALTYAINRQEIVDGVLLGLGQVAHGPYKPGTWPYNANVRQYPYDPQRALELLAEAGWRDTTGDGLLDKDGRTLSFTILTNQGNDQRIKAGEIIQRRLSEIGIDVRLRVIEWASFLKEFVTPGNFDAIIMGWTIPPDPDAFAVWHSSRTRPGELNFIGFENAEVDGLLERGRHTLDQDERKRYYHRFQEILAEEQPYTFLFVPDALPVVARRFRGIEPAPAGIGHNFIRWYVPEGEQRHQW